MPREEAPKVHVRAAPRLGQGRSAFLAVICSRRSGLRSAARRRGAAAARASRPSVTWLGFAPTCLRARAPRRSARGARRRAPLAAPSGTCAHSRAQLIGFRAGGRLAKVVAKAFWSGMTRGKRTGGEQTAVRSPMSAQPAGRRCTSSPAAFLVAKSRARCTGHLGGRLRRQRSNLRNLFAWDLVDPVAYRPIPLALHGFHRRPAQELLPQNAVPAAAEVPPNAASAGAAARAGSRWLLLRVYVAVTSTQLCRGAAHVTANEGPQVRRCAADAL